MTPPATPGSNPDAPSQDWADLCALGDVPDQGGFYIVHRSHALAIFKVASDQVRVLDDACPHAGASLSGGHIQSEEPLQSQCVVCPWHGWAFDIDTGRCPDNPEIKVNTYPARIIDGCVWAQLNG